MTYPLSSDVVPGQPTAADHYNNLRADALRLGQAAADSCNLPDLLSRYEQNLTIIPLSTDRLRVPASTGAPVALVIDGYFILRSTINVDLPSNGKPSGSAALWYLFAVRTAGSTTFTLAVNSSPVESSANRLIGSFYWNGTAIEAATIRTSKADAISTLIHTNQFVVCQARLSTNDVPYFADFNGGSNIYLVPYKGNQISFFVSGWGWNAYPISSAHIPYLPLSGLNVNKCYDVFSYWDGAAVQLESLAWTNLLSRATALTYQDGVYLKSTDLTRLYVGSFVPQSASGVNDYPDERGLWNYFNRVPRLLKNLVATASWTYNSATWRSPNASDCKFRYMVGIAEDTSIFDLNADILGASSLYGLLGLGLDSNTLNSADIMTHVGGASLRAPGRASLRSVLSAGCHDIYWLEATNGSGNVTFYGSPISSQSQGGLTGVVMG